MSYYQKFMTTYASKKRLLLLTAGFLSLTSMVQDRANFSGEWKLNEGKSERISQFPLCTFGGDRMRSKILRIATRADYLSVEVASSSPDGELVSIQEQLVFDGKESEITYVGVPREKSTAIWADDGQTMIVNSVRSFDAINKTADVKVKEVWKVIDGGKSISILVTSTSRYRGDTMRLIYDKQRAEDYRF